MIRIEEIISSALAGIEETEVAILARELLKTREALALAQQAKGEAEGRAALAERRAVLRNQKLVVVSAPPAESLYDELPQKYEGVTFAPAPRMVSATFLSDDLAKAFIEERISPFSSGIFKPCHCTPTSRCLACQEMDKPSDVKTDFPDQAYTSIETAELRELEACCRIFQESQKRALAERNQALDELDSAKRRIAEIEASAVLAPEQTEAHAGLVLERLLHDLVMAAWDFGADAGIAWDPDADPTKRGIVPYEPEEGLARARAHFAEHGSRSPNSAFSRALQAIRKCLAEAPAVVVPDLEDGDDAWQDAAFKGVNYSAGLRDGYNLAKSRARAIPSDRVLRDGEVKILESERRELALLRQHFQLFEKEHSEDLDEADRAFNARQEVDESLRQHLRANQGGADHV